MNTSNTPFYRNEKLIARAMMIIVFLASIRCIGEFFRLTTIHGDALTVEQVMPFLIGAFITSIACLLMTILSFWPKNRLIIAIAILSIIALFFLKSHYSL